MLLKMLQTRKGRHTDFGVQLFEKNRTYDLTCEALTRVFLKEGWAETVEGGAAVTLNTASGGDFDPEAVDASTDLQALSLDKLRATAKTLKIAGWHNSKKDTLIDKIAAEVVVEFDATAVVLTEEVLNELTSEQLVAVAEAYQVETQGADADDLKLALLDIE